MADEAVELDERAGVEELLEPLPGEQLPALALPRDVLLARRRACASSRSSSSQRSFASVVSCVSATGAEPKRPAELWSDRRQLLTFTGTGSVKKSTGVRVGSVGGSVPLDRSTTWPYEDGELGAFSYARFSSPTVAAAEARARGARRRRGASVRLGHGGVGGRRPRAAVTRPDDRPRRGRLLRNRRAVRRARAAGACGHVEFDQTGPPPPDADLVWIEAPSNPFLTMPDFEAAAAHAAPVVCDSTAATPLHVRPLERGCDIALHSATKGLAGHDDALVGVLVMRDRGDGGAAPRVPLAHGPGRGARRRLAAPPRAADARGAGRPPDRDSRVPSPSGFGRIAAVETVRYPGFGALMSFDVADAEAARRVETSTRLIANKTSLGGVTSRIEARSRWEGDRVPPGLLRCRSASRTPRRSGPISSTRSRSPERER